MEYHYIIKSPRYDLYQLQAGMIQFCTKYYLPAEVQHKVQLLAEEVLQIVPLDKGEVDFELRYSEENGSLSLELLMPIGITKVLNSSLFSADNLSLSIINGLCDSYDETMEDCPIGPRVRLKFNLKK